MKSMILQCLFLYFFNSVQLYRKKVLFLQVLLLKNSFFSDFPYIYVVHPLLLSYDIYSVNAAVHGALHHAARHPAGKIAVACIQPLAVRRLFNGLDALQFAAGWAVNCN